KTGLTKSDIDEFVESNSGANAYCYFNYQRANFATHCIAVDNTFGKVINRLIELGIFKDKNVPEKWVNVFCNYWIADKKTWDRYIKILNEVLRLFQQDTILVDILKDNNFSYRGKNYSNIPFALEYIFGLFLADNPDILWKEIPVK